MSLFLMAAGTSRGTQIPSIADIITGGGEYDPQFGIAVEAGMAWLRTAPTTVSSPPETPTHRSTPGLEFASNESR